VEHLIEVFGRLHPVLNHLPIGLLVGLLAIEIVATAISSPLPRRVITGLVWITAFTAVIAAFSGWVLSRESQYGGGRIVLHMRLGIALAALTVVLAFAHLRAREGTRETGLKVYRSILVVAVLLLLPTGHLGGTITHGEGFLTAPLRAGGTVQAAERAAAKRGAATAETPEFARDIAPILADRCGACHGVEKRKGGLSFADRESILAGGRDGPVLVAGKAEESEMVRRMRLPLDDEDHMPPDTKPQPSAAEIDAIARWIAAGARFAEGEPETAAAPPTATPTSSTRVAEPAAAIPEPPRERGASAEDLERLRTALVHVAPVSKDSELLWIDFAAAAPAVGDAEAASLLEPVADWIFDLSLARTRVTDGTMALVARMPKLSRLDLRETGVTDAGIAALAGHTGLTELVAPRTKLTDGAVQHILRLPKLRRVFLWNSGVTIRGIADLRLGREDLVIEAGDPGDARPLETEGKVVLEKPAPKPAPADGTGTGALPAPSNTACPVSGRPVDPAYQVVYRGRVIGFCCPNCPAKFWADPETYAAKVK
jgi:uncharacterized membrane protein/mono/diheme cytochrome c family protein/YHS domain-containing protein